MFEAMDHKENAERLAEHYKALAERFERESLFYQALQYHALGTIKGQQKGLKRLARRVKKLQAEKPNIVDELRCWQLLYRQDADDNFDQFKALAKDGDFERADECECTYGMRVTESDLLGQLIRYLSERGET